MQRKSNKTYRYQFRWHGHRYSVTAHTQYELMEKVKAKKEELEKGFKKPENILLGEVKEKWLTTTKAGKVSDATYHAYGSYLKKIGMDNTYVVAVRPSDLQEVINRYADKSASFLKKLHVTMIALFDWCIEEGIVNRNPAKKLTIPKKKSGTHHSLTEAERELILRVSQGKRYRNLIEIMYYCGLRPSEVTRVQARDIDWKKRSLHVRGTKTASADRIVPIPNTLYSHLASTVDRTKPFQLVLRNFHGDPCTRDSLGDMWKECKRDMQKEIAPVQLRDTFRLYDLRHDYCTRLQAAGVPITEARYLMGHSDISITAKIYTHFDTEAFEDVVEKINNAF